LDIRDGGIDLILGEVLSAVTGTGRGGVTSVAALIAHDFGSVKQVDFHPP